MPSPNFASTSFAIRPANSSVTFPSLRKLLSRTPFTKPNSLPVISGDHQEMREAILATPPAAEQILGSGRKTLLYPPRFLFDRPLVRTTDEQRYRLLQRYCLSPLLGTTRRPAL